MRVVMNANHLIAYLLLVAVTTLTWFLVRPIPRERNFWLLYLGCFAIAALFMILLESVNPTGYLSVRIIGLVVMGGPYICLFYKALTLRHREK